MAISVAAARGKSSEPFMRSSISAVFARILDDQAGHFSIRPRQIVEVTRRYQEGTLVLTTRFRASSGVVELSDALAMAEGVRGHDLGLESPHVLLWRAKCVEGEVELDVEFGPRPEYGLTFPFDPSRRPWARCPRWGRHLVLSTQVPARGRFDCSRECEADQREDCGMGGRLGVELGSPPSDVEPGPYRGAHRRHGRRLAVLAGSPPALRGPLCRAGQSQRQGAPGSYLPSYPSHGRCCYDIASRGGGRAPELGLPLLLDTGRQLHPRRPVGGGLPRRGRRLSRLPDHRCQLLPATTGAADHVRYQRGAEPHRTGAAVAGRLEVEQPGAGRNGARAQRQLDIYGELLAAIHRREDQLPDLDRAERALLAGLADVAAEAWTQPDHGMWEIRGEPRHYLHSKLMCWVALDRAIDLAGLLQADNRVDDWKKARAEIRDAILSEGWSEYTQTFTQSFQASTLDASALIIPIVGFLPFDDPRVISTIEAVRDQLTDARGLVHRYRSDDGLHGEEGAFLLCTFWLAEALARAGRPDEARQVFEQAVGYGNDVGLLSETRHWVR